MLIRSFRETEEAGKVVSISHGKSTAVRVLLKKDGLGFSLSEARGGAGNVSTLWYKNHWEANYIRAGRGSIQELSTGVTWDLFPGVLYCVGPRDRHQITNSDDPLRIVSIFNPPIEGLETHDKDGAYPPTGDIPGRKENMFVRTSEGVRGTGGEKVVSHGRAVALRLLTASDGLGFSLSDVRIEKGITQDLWYKNHWEANLILAGELEVVERNSGVTHHLEAGNVYCVGPDDPHTLHSKSDVQLIAIFNPPLQGDEQHDEDGAYPPTGPIPPGPAG